MMTIAHRWGGVGSGYPRGLFANGELGCWFDCNAPDAFTDTARTVAATVGQAVAGLAGRSGNGLHAAQATSNLRPLLARVPPRGRKNVLVQSADLANAAWVRTNCTVVAQGDGSFLLTDDAVVGNHCVYSSQTPPADTTGTYARSIEVKKGTARYIFLSTNTTASSTNTTLIVDLDTRTVTQGFGAGTVRPIVDLGGGWMRITYAATAPSPSFRRLCVGISPVATFTAAGDLNYAGTGSTVFLRRGQVELGTDFSWYQTVVTDLDVTEAGARNCWHMYSDLFNDTLPVTLPSLGSAATLFYATEAGSVILSGQTIGAGAFEVLRGQRTFACGAINRALTAAETATLTRYLDARRAAA